MLFLPPATIRLEFSGQMPGLTLAQAMAANQAAVSAARPSKQGHGWWS
jgi:hypothetical protein